MNKSQEPDEKIPRCKTLLTWTAILGSCPTRLQIPVISRVFLLQSSFPLSHECARLCFEPSLESAAQPELLVVIPALNEAGNIRPLCNEWLFSPAEFGRSLELMFICKLQAEQSERRTVQEEHESRLV
ncbi:MAG: hypothetical protein K2X93_08545 [Candidatus Obscuribacterales bacterium]|nr:hypothetical protein [Candidatus Obscuribacterales bacterium]